MLRRSWRARGRSREGYRARVRCAAHEIDLEALRRFTADGSPSADRDAPRAIADRECPACRPRYVAGAGSAVHVSREPGGWVHCSCCGTSWHLEDDSWEAVVGPGLVTVDDASRLPAGATIDGGSFAVATLDPVATLEEVFRSELVARLRARGGLHPDGGSGETGAARGAGQLDAEAEDFVDFLVDGVLSAARGKADLDSQIALGLQERGLDEPTQVAWYDEIVAVLTEIQRAMGRLVRLQLPRRGPHGGVELPDDRVDEIVRSTIASLPPEFAAEFENVAVVVENEHGRRDLFGLYEGVPTTARSRLPYRYPDRITIFTDTICANARTEAGAEEQIRRTVLHEIGHYFGIDDARLRELGW